ncbi:MAG TPA: Rieske 2Fe-2S domain-containing protein, partial [Dehalococcoidia bacterium]|nr:Rieske 2Fe-2S domain-containing protein [Dehalococcoidia bacterium]
MLSVDDNQTLIQIGPGQPMGETFRRFWIPALLSEEVASVDGAPVRLRLLGEDLVAFRDTNGNVGIFDAYCPHRNAPLFFGRNEEEGLRCIYHGWKFDVTGACVDMPNCLEGDSFKERVRVRAYPTFEGGNMIWVYMGPAERVPPRPGFEWLDLPSDHVYVTKYFVSCNYLQTLENEFDIGHSAFLHRTLNPAASQSYQIIGRGQPAFSLSRIANTEVYDTPYGSASGRRAEDGRLALSSHFIMPSFSTAGAVSAPNTNPLNLKVPVDDENTVFFRMKWSPEPLKAEVLNTYLHGKHEFPERIPGTYVTKANKSNDYLQDRALQRNFNFSGMNPYP